MKVAFLHILTQFPFTTNETELDYYLQKLNGHAVLRPKTYRAYEIKYFEENI